MQVEDEGEDTQSSSTSSSVQAAAAGARALQELASGASQELVDVATAEQSQVKESQINLRISVAFNPFDTSTQQGISSSPTGEASTGSAETTFFDSYFMTSFVSTILKDVLDQLIVPDVNNLPQDVSIPVEQQPAHNEALLRKLEARAIFVKAVLFAMFNHNESSTDTAVTPNKFQAARKEYKFSSKRKEQLLSILGDIISVVLADFGLSLPKPGRLKDKPYTVSVGSANGTRWYRSPESACITGANKIVFQGNDIYSLAISIIKLCIGLKTSEQHLAQKIQLQQDSSSSTDPPTNQAKEITLEKAAADSVDWKGSAVHCFQKR